MAHTPTLLAWLASDDPVLRRAALRRLEGRPADAPAASTRPEVVIPPRDRDPSRQLVVAAYREDLAWLADVACDVLVYTKGGACPVGVPCVRLPNARREAGTILHHVVTRWDDLAPLTVFCQGHPFDHSPDFLARLALPYTAPTSLTTRYLPDVPPPGVKARDRVTWFHGFESRYGDALADHADGSTGSQWFDPAAWAYVFDCPVPRPLWFGYGATWAVPRDVIRRRPRAFYAHLLSVCDSGASGRSRTDPPVNPWSLEALWRYVWSDPLEYPHRDHEAAPGPPARAPFVMPKRYAGPMPDCPHAERGYEGSCNPVRCLAGRGTTCGGSHSDLDHCHACLGSPARE